MTHVATTNCIQNTTRLTCKSSEETTSSNTSSIVSKFTVGNQNLIWRHKITLYYVLAAGKLN